MWCLGGVWVVLGWCLGGDSNWLASFKDVAGGLRLLHGFYFGGKGCCLRSGWYQDFEAVAL